MAAVVCTAQVPSLLLRVVRDAMASRLTRRSAGQAGFFSSARRLKLLPGAHIAPDRVRGYYIDFSVKAVEDHWPPRWLRNGRDYVRVCQFGLGAYERYLRGDGERWRAVTLSAADHLLAAQERDGRSTGGWAHHRPGPSAYRLASPWYSAMAQGEGASVLIRAFGETRDERYAEAAAQALVPLTVPSASGGVAAQLDGGFFPEEYPSAPSSFVLNGGIFALWGCRDVAMSLADPRAERLFSEGVETLAANIDRWDAGYWSRYDLYPHPTLNVASSAYHLLHISQLQVMQRLLPDPRIVRAAARFEHYFDSRVKRGRAFGRKALFRVVVPRSRRLARALPWAPAHRA